MFDIFKTRGANDKKSKILIIGASGVGKTSLRTRFIKGNFRTNELMTIGVEFASTEMDVNGFQLKLELYDIAGQEAFQLDKKLVKHIHGVMIVFDLTRQETLFSIRSWVDKIYDLSPKFKGPVLIVGNKLDLRSQREIPKDEVEKLVQIIEKEKHVNTEFISFAETSAKTGKNIDLAFRKLAKDITKVYYK